MRHSLFLLLIVSLSQPLATVHVSADPGKAAVDAGIAELKIRAQKGIARSKVPGVAVAIIHGDVVTYLNFGTRLAGEKRPVSEDTVFQIASVSKPITATILAKLVGEGRFSWDDKIAGIDPSFVLKDPSVTQLVTFRDLLSHRSGLPDHAGDLAEDLGFTQRQIFDRLRIYDLGARFRAAYAYTNYGVTEAGVAGALASGRNLAWDRLAEEIFFRPLGMNHTSYRYADFVAAKNRAPGHVAKDGQWFANGEWAPLFQRNPDQQAPAGGVSSTTRDLAIWVKLILNRGLFEGKAFIDPKGVAAAQAQAAKEGVKLFDLLDQKSVLGETHQVQPITGGTSHYGMCWNVGTAKTGQVAWSHSGELSLGVRSAVTIWPQEKLGIVTLVNASPSGLPEGLAMDFADLVFGGKVMAPDGLTDWIDFAEQKFAEMLKADLHEDPTDYTTPPVPATAAGLPLASYAGAYSNPVFGPLQIAVVKGGLVMTMGPKAVKFGLTHYQGDTFFFTTQGEMHSGLSGAVFQISGGAVSSVLLHAYNKEGLGTFTRAGG